MAQGLSKDDVMQFVCEHCQVSITLDDDLAGVMGPCPSCGKIVTPPSLDEGEDLKALSGSESEVKPLKRKLKAAESLGSVKRQSRREGRRGLIQLLVVGFVVLLLVLALTYFLR